MAHKTYKRRGMENIIVRDRFPKPIKTQKIEKRIYCYIANQTYAGVN